MHIDMLNVCWCIASHDLSNYPLLTNYGHKYMLVHAYVCKSKECSFGFQNLGVPSHLIPAVIDAQKEAAAAEAAAAAAKKEKVGTMN